MAISVIANHAKSRRIGSDESSTTMAIRNSKGWSPDAPDTIPWANTCAGDTPNTSSKANNLYTTTCYRAVP